MARIPKTIEYPTSDGKPMAETDVHRDVMFELIFELGRYYSADPMVYVSGDLLIFYEQGNKRRRIDPDVFVVWGVPKHRRLNYLIWEEGKGPGFVIEVTSKSTRHEDQKTKLLLYRDTLRVPEYFLFDPFGEYLKPSLQGYRLIDGEYEPIEFQNGRLLSATTGLHLERQGDQLRLYDPTTSTWLPTPIERTSSAEALARKAEAHAREAEAHAREAEDRAAGEKKLRLDAEVELARLRRELEALRRGEA